MSQLIRDFLQLLPAEFLEKPFEDLAEEFEDFQDDEVYVKVREIDRQYFQLLQGEELVKVVNQYFAATKKSRSKNWSEA